METSDEDRLKQQMQYGLQRKVAGAALLAIVLIITILFVLYSNSVKVYALGDLREELAEPWPDVVTVQIQWGSETAKITETWQIEQLRKRLAALRVQKKEEVPDNQVTAGTIAEPYHNTIQFFDANQNLLARFSFYEDGSQIASQETKNEDGAHLKVMEPDVLVGTLFQYGLVLREQLKNTTFLADLNHDGLDEEIVVNPRHWQQDQCAEMTIYGENDAVLLNTALFHAHAGWGNYFLYQRDGKDYLLYYNPSMYQGYADYHWYLLQLDENGQILVVEEDRVEFTINPEQYQFDVQAIYDFTMRLETMLQDAVLLVSVEDAELQYSTIDQQIKLSAEDLMSWLQRETQEGTLLEKLQRKQEDIYFDGPRSSLQQWLKFRRIFDATQHELLHPTLVTINGEQCVSFDIHWLHSRFIATYALSTHDYDNGRAVSRGRRYYQYHQSENEWILLQDDSKQKDSQMADHWAQTFIDRDGIGRYGLLNADLQKQIDTYTMEDDFALWMPIWVTSEDGSKGMFLRGSSPWVESYQVEMHRSDGTEKAAFMQKTSALITYDMMDSGQEHYVYQEALAFERDDDIFRVSACEVTADMLSPEIYQQAQQILTNIKDGRDTWRLEPKQVALAFVHDYLALSDGSLSQWNAKENSFVYTSAAGKAYTIYLYHPVIQPFDTEPDFWAVREYAYSYKDPSIQKNEMLYQHDIRFDSWASLHIQ